MKRGYTAALGKPPPPPREDGGQPAPKNSERDAHRLFSRLGLSLKMPIRTKTFAVDDGQAVEMHYIRIADWVKYLLKTPSLLAGAGTEKLESQCRAFWTMYKWHHPDHVIYQDEDKLSTTLPLLLYGDEGKGPRRGNYMVTTIELPETTCTLLCVCRFVEPSLKYCFSSETDHKGVQWVATSTMLSRLFVTVLRSLRHSTRKFPTATVQWQSSLKVLWLQRLQRQSRGTLT